MAPMAKMYKYNQLHKFLLKQDVKIWERRVGIEEWAFCFIWNKL